MINNGKFSIVTFGCKLNQYESQAIRELMQRAGYHEGRLDEGPDVCIVNTCAVTQATENECRRLVRRLSQRDGIRVIVTGCVAELPWVEAWAGQGHVEIVRKEEAGHIVSILRGTQVVGTPASSLPTIFDLTVSTHAGHARAFLKIQDGCDACCSYCVVPRARGASRSRPVADILAEAERLTRNGYREIVLTGVNIGSYGKDVSDGMSLASLLRQLVHVGGIGRIRLGSLEMGDLSDELLALVASDGRICPHFHIPIQSGDDEILRRMNRTYTATEYLRMAERIRNAIELPALTTDVIVGFPGESDAAFSNTLNFCQNVGFSRIHVFSFSPRPGTPAATMARRVPSPTVRKRKEALQAAAAETCEAYHRQMLGRTADLLVEYGRDPRTGLLHGHTERYVGVLVDGPDKWAGSALKVKMTELKEGHLRGIPTETPPEGQTPI